MQSLDVSNSVSYRLILSFYKIHNILSKYFAPCLLYGFFFLILNENLGSFLV